MLRFINISLVSSAHCYIEPVVTLNRSVLPTALLDDVVDDLRDIWLARLDVIRPGASNEML